MFDHLDPSKAGAETKADVGIFLVGASIGGAVDAIFNFAGFAEPLVFAGICGAGVLGVKKLIDARLHDKKTMEDTGPSKGPAGGRSKK